MRLRIREITETRVHYGYRRVHVILRREDWRDNHKRIYRLYSEQELYPNHVWGIGFVSDA
ncbi:TPA: transposase [Klebsiella pneumoniae]|nr:transposase [Klebsiella pneumoniae]HBZ7975367.1 transposase [Klebsiella pneumoniae]HCB4001092.1 transposase [Klebsiella pneumoniae]